MISYKLTKKHNNNKMFGDGGEYCNPMFGCYIGV